MRNSIGQNASCTVVGWLCLTSRAAFFQGDVVHWVLMFPSLFFPRPSQPPVFDCLQDAKFQAIKTGAAILQAIKIGDGEALGNWLSMLMRLIMLSNETTQNKSVVRVSQIAFKPVTYFEFAWGVNGYMFIPSSTQCHLWKLEKCLF